MTASDGIAVNNGPNWGRFTALSPDSEFELLINKGKPQPLTTCSSSHSNSPTSLPVKRRKEKRKTKIKEKS